MKNKVPMKLKKSIGEEIITEKLYFLVRASAIIESRILITQQKRDQILELINDLKVKE